MDKPVLGKNISHGQANFAPGLPSVLLLGPQGLEKNVAAHEWAHAEFAHRLGVIKRTYAFPTWFDEGLAMQVDFRTPYNSEALAHYLSQDGMHKPNLDDISDARFFIPGDQGKLHYAYSRCIMESWIKQNPDWLLKIESTSILTKFPTEEFGKLPC